MKINKYPDGTSYVSVKYINKGETPFKLNSYEDLWHLNQYVDSYNNTFTEPPTITIPNLIDAQADKRFNREESSGLKLVCKFLNGMNANFKIFHPHNPEVVEALMDNVEIIDNSEFIDSVLKNLPECKSVVNRHYYGLENLILMSSDAGGFKPLMKLCDKVNWQGETASANKSRTYVNGETKLVQGLDRDDYKGKDILIVDDISVYGGTFKGLSKLLRERNCGKLYLAVSHMTVQHHSKQKETDKSVFEYFDRVFTTNSKFDEYTVDDWVDEVVPKNLEIIKLF